MNIEITGRHIEVTPALKEFTEDKLRKLERLLDGELEAHVVLAIEKHRHMAEIQVKSRHTFLSGHLETDDLYTSIREVAEKLERQALKFKQKVTAKHRRAEKLGSAAAQLEEQALAAAAEREPAHTGNNSPRIVPKGSHRAKPMSPEDAVLELQSAGDDVIVFRNSSTDRVNVLYNLGGGEFGLVETD